MRTPERTILSMVMAAAVAGSAVASTGIRPVAGSRNDRAVAAVAASGRAFVTARDVQVDLEFPGGTTAKGRIEIVFDRSTGLFVHMLEWFPKEDYPQRPWLDAWQIGIDVDRLFMVCVGGMEFEIDIMQSTEKADSLDDAEAKSLKWHTDHTAQTAALPGWDRVTRLTLDRYLLPKGFLQEYDPRPIRPIKLIDMVPENGEWDLTIENTDTHRKAKVMIGRLRNEWFTRQLRLE